MSNIKNKNLIKLRENENGYIYAPGYVCNIRQLKNKKVLDVIVVTDRLDAYSTIIHPDGCVHSLTVAPVDYNHNRIGTGSKIIDEAITEIEVVKADNIAEKATALIATIEVYEDSKAWTRDNKDKPSEEVASLYDYVESGRVGWVSIDFEPLEIATVSDSKGNIIREEYYKWRLNYLSLLDVRAGQDESQIINIRSKNFQINLKKEQNMNTDQEQNKNTVDEELKALLYKRNWVNCAVKRLSDGILGVVTKTTQETDSNGVEIKTATISTVDGQTMTVDGNKIGWSNEPEEYDWMYAETGDVITYIISLNSPNIDSATKSDQSATRSALEEANAKIATLETQVAEVAEQNKKFEELHQRLLNSPEQKLNLDSDPATDMNGEGAEIESNLENKRSLREEILERSEYPDFNNL